MKMAIFGLARSGVSALKYLSATEHECFAVNRGEPKSWERIEEITKLIPLENCLDEKEAHDLFASMDLIIKSPGIPYGHPSLEGARNKKVEIVSEIEFAYRELQGVADIPIVAITGTNGKTTTAIMTADLLRSMGMKTFLGGNIGHPFSEILTDKENYDVAVIEVSSFQLENIVEFKPKVGILTNISPSHAERYESHELYRDAKLKLFQNMDDDGLALAPKDLIDLNLPCPKEAIKTMRGLDLSASKIIGRHNLKNLFCAFKAASRIAGDEEKARSSAQKYIETFKGPPYRMEFVREVNGLKIINDGKSTNLAATRAALDSFPFQDVILILGGKLRSEEMDFAQIEELELKRVMAFGEAGSFIEKKLGSLFEVEVYKNLTELFAGLRERSEKGILLFSPAFPSFDLYKDYEERGKHFNELSAGL